MLCEAIDVKENQKSINCFVFNLYDESSEAVLYCHPHHKDGELLAYPPLNIPLWWRFSQVR